MTNDEVNRLVMLVLVILPLEKDAVPDFLVTGILCREL